MDKIKTERKPRQPKAEKPKAKRKRKVLMTNFKQNFLEIII
jgi:hypothetical protein